MLIPLSLGWLLLVAGAYCATRARALDLQLQRRMPPHIERRCREYMMRGLDQHEREELADELLGLGLGWARPRWDRRFHTTEGAALVDRLFLLVGLTCALAGCGFILIAFATQ